MKCQHCSADLEDGALFCRECGQKVERQITYCRECGCKAAAGSKFCSSCGTRISVDIDVQYSLDKEDDAYEEEPKEEQDETFEIPLAPKNSLGSSGPPDNLFERALHFVKRKIKEFWNNRSPYGKVITIFIALFVLLGLIAFLFGKNTAGTIAIIQIVLTIVALLMKKRIIKAPKTWLHIIALGLAIVLLFPYVNLFRGNVKDAEPLEWSEFVLGNKIPETKSKVGRVSLNSDRYLNLDVYNTNLDKFEDYVEKCKKYGFTVDIGGSEGHFYAYNIEGYELSLYLYMKDNEMHISLSAPEVYGKLTWPDSPLAKLIPAPNSNSGNIETHDHREFMVFVANTTKEQFNSYIEECMNVGFNVGPNRSKKRFSAKDLDGNDLVVAYRGNNVISITVTAASESADNSIESNTEAVTEDVTVATEAATEPSIETTEALEKLQWPRNPLAALIPVPTSEYGTIQHSNDDELQIWVDQVNKDDFDAYVSACAEKGFTNIKKESSYEFEATNQEGYQLRLYYANTGGMRITVKQPLFAVDLTLDCIPNLLFDKYDITAWVDDVEITSVVHGGESTVKLELEKGSHTLVVIKHGWKEPKGAVTFDVVADTIIAYQLSCGKDVISLKQIEYIELRELSETEARVPAAASELKYDNYKNVVDALTNAGFTNIKTSILYDIVYGWTSEGEVDSVTIAGSTDFTTGSIFDKDAEVIVTYHMYEDDDPSRIKMSKKASDYEGKHYSEVQKAFKNLGFTNIVLEEEETTDASYENGEVYRITIDYEHFEVGDAYMPDDKVLIKYYIVDTRDASAEESDPPTAATEYVETVLTVENCDDLKKLIRLDWQKDRTAISNFASAHKGDTIRLEMLTAYVERNGSYKTRFNYTLYAVDGDNVMLSGPVFMFEDVNYSDLHLVGSNVPDTFGTGIHCRVKATIVRFENGMILLDPEAITVIEVYD